MFFTAHVEYYDDYTNANKFELIGFFADSFGAAASLIENTYGSDLETIHLLRPITDNPFIYLTDRAEDEIVNNELNSF